MNKNSKKMPTQYRYEARKDFVFNMTKLGLWYLYNNASSDESFLKILNNELPNFRLTTIWDGIHHPASDEFPKNSEWRKLANSLLNLYRNATNIIDFEKKGFDLFKPYIEKRIEIDISAWPWIPSGYSTSRMPNNSIFGIFAYTVEQLGEETVHFHIANSCMPKSPFADINARAKELLSMIRNIKQRASNTTRIGCNSWLNSFPPFLKLFPPEYPKTKATIEPLSYSFNWWGQFLSRDGSFNKKNREKMYKTGKFPYLSIDGNCSIDNLEDHLLTRLFHENSKTRT